MTIVVEDGTGLDDAESYIAVIDADEYHLARGNDDWDEGDESEKEAVLRIATAYIDGYYRDKWPGLRTNGRSQALEWPRMNAYDTETNLISSDEIPIEVINATAEAALRELKSRGSLLPEGVPADRIIEKTIGPLRFKYDDRGSSVPRFSTIDNILSSLIGRTQSMTKTLMRS